MALDVTKTQALEAGEDLGYFTLFPEMRSRIVTATNENQVTMAMETCRHRMDSYWDSWGS